MHRHWAHTAVLPGLPSKGVRLAVALAIGVRDEPRMVALAFLGRRCCPQYEVRRCGIRGAGATREAHLGRMELHMGEGRTKSAAVAGDGREGREWRADRGPRGQCRSTAYVRVH